MKEREIVINIENCIESMNQEGGVSPNSEVCGIPMNVDALANGESSLSPLRSARDGGGVSPISEGKTRKERRSKMSAKKPPRPPRGLSLDAADQKLIKEISELLMMKRARIERIKALKKAKAAKGMSSSASSAGNFIAMLFTLLFCIVIIFQGCHPWGNFTRNSSAVGDPISPMSDGATEGNVLALKETQNLSSGSVHMSYEVGSPNLLVRGSDNKAEGGRAIH
ncbi:uncharacterized protein LOC121767619 isoform X1 [Salvia splendens]|uniref:uncharacterized protein LOC121767619 isoform X1 n=2 Tax=Salvia splendens TaxID=180675 RepID=UPI001C273370|nr:uncharacterized protein LOC121767619 isoform X1 [Salvia splendens]XP_042019874.1 uncharacterized protein LOC121767619 isoform X1 [Salvia splendens]